MSLKVLKTLVDEKDLEIITLKDEMKILVEKNKHL